MAYLERQLSTPGPDQFLAVFVEPKVEGAFPDVVAVLFDTMVARSWPESRKGLEKQDLRLIHFCHGVNRFDPAELAGRFGRASARRSIERLVAAGLIEQGDGDLRLVSLKDAIAVRRVVSIEAKMSEPSRGLCQAVQNTWFATDSYLLLPVLPRDPTLLQRAREAGVRVITCDEPLVFTTKTRGCTKVPTSYYSWFFNEWTWHLHDSQCSAELPVSGRLAAAALS